MLTAVILAVIEGPQLGWLSPLVVGSALVGVLLLVAFTRNEARSDGPLIDAATRRDPRLLWGAATMSALFFAVFGAQFVITQWIQGPLGESAIVAGLFFVPAAVAAMITAVCNPRFVRGYGHGRVAASGLGATALGAMLAAGAVAVGSLEVVAVAGLFLGIGIGTASASGAELIMSSAPPGTGRVRVGRERDARRSRRRPRDRGARQRARRDRQLRVAAPGGRGCRHPRRHRRGARAQPAASRASIAGRGPRRDRFRGGRVDGALHA